MKGFNKELLLSNVTKEAQQKAQRLVNRTLYNMIEELMFLSPVGLPEDWSSTPPKDYKPGKYKANWQHSVGSPKTDVLDDEDNSILDSKSRTSVKLKQSVDANKTLFTTHYFTNNVPYAEAIEYGSAIHNLQAQSKPHAVAGLVTQNIPSHIKKARAEVGL